MKHNVQNSFDLVKTIRGITLRLISYDVVGLSTSMPPCSVIDVVHQAYLHAV